MYLAAAYSGIISVSPKAPDCVPPAQALENFLTPGMLWKLQDLKRVGEENLATNNSNNCTFRWAGCATIRPGKACSRNHAENSTPSKTGQFGGLLAPSISSSVQFTSLCLTLFARRDPERGLQSWFRPAKPETRNPKPTVKVGFELRNPKPETRNPKPTLKT